MASTFTLLVGLALLGLAAARIMARLALRTEDGWLIMHRNGARTCSA